MRAVTAVLARSVTSSAATAAAAQTQVSMVAATAAAVTAERGLAGGPAPFVPALGQDPFPESAYQQLEEFVGMRSRVLVITGAGCSTESGIPDYRSPNGAYSKGHKPVTYTDFTRVDVTRRRYWARSFTGWPIFGNVRPNPTHYGIAALQAKGLVHDLITQNVDRLHQRAHTTNVIELHGSQYSVSCLKCKHRMSRDHMQELLVKANPGWRPMSAVLSVDNDAFTQRPDGDVDFTARTDFENFDVPCCPACGGLLKPDVVFFGENVPKDVVERAFAAVRQSDGIVAAGSSLQVYSIYRFIRAAVEQSIPVAIVNIGPTRGDDDVALRVPALTSTTFKRLAHCFAPDEFERLAAMPLGKTFW